MELAKYDGQCVRITLKDGDVFEGACVYDGEEYIIHEIGGDEDALEMSQWVFYNSQIEKVEIIGEDGFTAPYGRLEEETVKDFDFLEDVLFSDEPTGVLRLLCCVEKEVKINAEIEEMLVKLINFTDDKRIKEKAGEILALRRDKNE